MLSFLPAALVYSIPWGFLTAVLLVFGRLSAGNELTAMRTAGMSIVRIARPVLLLAVAASALCLWIDLEVAPRYLQNLQTAFVQMATSNPSAAFTGDQVINEFPGNKIFVGSKTGNKLENIRVFELDEGEPPGARRFRPDGHAGNGHRAPADHHESGRQPLRTARL